MVFHEKQKEVGSDRTPAGETARPRLRPRLGSIDEIGVTDGSVEAAGDGQGFASDPRGIWGGQEGHGWSDVLRLPDSTEWG